MIRISGIVAVLLIVLVCFAGIRTVWAHPVGRVCAYTDVDGYRATDYCHHLMATTPAEVYVGLPGLRLGFGGGGAGGWHRGMGGGRQWRQDHGWRGPQMMNPAPGAQFNFNFGGGHGGGQGRHGQRP